MKTVAGISGYKQGNSTLQLVVAVFMAAVLPSVLLATVGELFDYRYRLLAPAWNAAGGVAIAVVLAHLAITRFNSYPGVSNGGYVLVSVMVAFAVVTTGYFIFRIPYSIAVYVAGVGTTAAYYMAMYFALRRANMPRLVLLPHANIRAVLEDTHVIFTQIDSPDQYRPGMGSPVMNMRMNYSDEWLIFATDCALKGIPVYHTKQIAEQIVGKVAVDHLAENSFGSLLPNPLYLQLKMVFDIALALVLFIPLMLLLLVLAPIMMIAQGRPVLFHQRRVGYRGKSFTVWKLRTMVKQAKATTARAAETKDGDERITGIGRILRRYRLDELPQIINVLKGEMSWIGPRPEARVLVETYQEALPFYHYRHIVRPGLTGWAQVNQGHVTGNTDVLAKLHYDFFYIKYLSAWLDFLIVLRTARVLVVGHGAK